MKDTLKNLIEKYNLVYDQKIITIGLPQFYEEGDFNITWESR